MTHSFMQQIIFERLLQAVNAVDIQQPTKQAKPSVFFVATMQCVCEAGRQSMKRVSWR